MENRESLPLLQWRMGSGKWRILRAPQRAIQSKIRMKSSEIRIFIQSQDMCLTLDTPTQPPGAASFGYRKPVSPEPVFVYRGL